MAGKTTDQKTEKEEVDSEEEADSIEVGIELLEMLTEDHMVEDIGTNDKVENKVKERVEEVNNGNKEWTIDNSDQAREEVADMKKRKIETEDKEK